MNEEELRTNEDFLEKDEGIAIMAAVHITRWTKNKRALYCPLSDGEINLICNSVFEKLDKAGFKIVKKD